MLKIVKLHESPWEEGFCNVPEGLLPSKQGNIELFPTPFIVKVLYNIQTYSNVNFITTMSKCQMVLIQH